MKETSLACILLVLCGLCMGQTVGEFFNQKKTEIKYMKAQIAALVAFEKFLSLGYQIGRDSLLMITNIDQSDLNLHAEHIASMDSVKPVIRDDPRVKAAFDLSMRIKKMGAEIASMVQVEGTPDANISDRVNQVCNQNEDCLAELTENGALRMSDEERLQLIDRVYKRLKDLYLVVQDTVRELRAATKNRI